MGSANLAKKEMRAEPGVPSACAMPDVKRTPAARAAKIICMLLALAQLGFCADSYWEVCGIGSFVGDNSPSSNGTNGLLWIALAFMVVAFAIALAYMHSKLRMDAQTEMWAKDEAQNLLISVLLFAGLLVFFSGSCVLAAEYIGSSPFGSAKSYINYLINTNGKNVLRSLTVASISEQKQATKFSYLGAAPFWGTGVGPVANKRALSSHKEIVIDIYLPILASLTAQKYLLDAMQWVGASVLLPFGFVMRLIPFTRDFGNTLIAIFFSIYIVVPLMYALSGEVFVGNATNPGVLGATYDKDNFYSYGLDGGGGSTAQDTVLFRVGSTIPQAIFIPNLVLVIGVTCAMAMSKALRALAV